ncbi:MAG TPA: polysaccharide deacetylase family protein [bacterium]|nr:polysaccharide deacetylase family protein [bacterium]
MSPQILLSFDLEEFDLPLEYGCRLDEESQHRVTLQGLEPLVGLLEKHGIQATFFTTSYFAEANPAVVRGIARTHEIASHGCRHSDFREADYHESKKILQDVTGQPISGFRMPRLGAVSFRRLKEAGYQYDSSINPTLVPGRYNHLLKPRVVLREEQTGLYELPCSVTPMIRFPLFWLAFKNLPFGVYLTLCRRTLRADSYLNLYFHPWEFADLTNFRIPFYCKRTSGQHLLSRFERLVTELGPGASFSSMADFLRSRDSVSG